MKKSFVLILTLLLALCMLCGCASESPAAEGGVTEIILSDSAAEIKGGGAAFKEGAVIISAVGSYRVSGSGSNVSVVVNTGDEAMPVTLILDNASISNPAGPAIHVQQAKDLELELASGSVNTLVSGTEAPLGSASEDASGAALYAEDDMDISGTEDSVLNVYGYINNGIACKNDLDIKGGSISVVAVNNGVRGSDSFEMKGGSLSVKAGNDGIKSTTADKDGKGYISIIGGTVSVEAMGDGISAETGIQIQGGSISVITTGDPDAASCKGIKANTELVVEGGSIAVNSADHALHCEGGVSIRGGALALLSSAGKGISSEGQVLISGGDLAVNSTGDAIETVGNVSIEGGSVRLFTAKDGVQVGLANSGAGDLSIKGGSLFVNAYKDGFNVQGGISCENGLVLVLCGECKESPALRHSPWTGIKGAALSLYLDGEELCALEAEHAYKHVCFFAGGEGLFELGDGISRVEIK